MVPGLAGGLAGREASPEAVLAARCALARATPPRRRPRRPGGPGGTAGDRDGDAGGRNNLSQSVRKLSATGQQPGRRGLVIGRILPRGHGVAGALRYLLGPGRHNKHVSLRIVAAWNGDPARLEPPRRGHLREVTRDDILAVLGELNGSRRSNVLVALRSLFAFRKKRKTVFRSPVQGIRAGERTWGVIQPQRQDEVDQAADAATAPEARWMTSPARSCWSGWPTGPCAGPTANPHLLWRYSLI
jgi:hypothetical protein